ncbi:putative AP-1-like transcription factor [Amylocarpus encephaloides]|uniref:AP-1-like transcription factor n=1 Tax=Amylocarpus encephaloides TaxID=45428 RepID=A0A9P8C7L1_9HELO|nr:putative AP-1-like transcription factor [Amylocarpus encephaloides]
MASPALSTPSASGSPSPVVLAPAPPNLAIKTSNAPTMASIAAAPGLPTPTMMTRKEWVIPPRPKPGRKPATDTPPTKRKAQNRAAQRAFRERRAARVGELEEQLEETKEEQQRREGELRNKVVRLEAELERFNSELQSWRLRCDTLDRIADYEKREKEAALAELSYLRNGSRMTGTDAVPLPPRRPREADQQLPNVLQYAQHIPSPAPDMEDICCGGCTSQSRCACVEEALANAPSGCGRCTTDSHCECLEETIREVNSQVPPELKRPHSPSTGAVEKRQRQSAPSTPLEIDFTAQFSGKSISNSAQPTPLEIQQRRPIESCGFCEEGTYCMCAEAATAAAAANALHEGERENRLAPLLNEVTPPPSDNDVDGSNIKLPSLQPVHIHRPIPSQTPSNSCANGPGTCQQCQADPKSGLFCRSLAALRVSSSSNSVPEGCCGGNGGGGGCCQSTPTPAATSQPPPSLSCADTYKTLSTHKNFDKASDDLGTWLGRLHATPPHHVGRAPIEVEAASVMGVLKLFDRRFGRG